MFAPMVVLAVEVTALVVVHVGAFVELSPVDELMHFDNTVRASAPDLVLDERGLLDQESLREIRCHEQYGTSWQLAPEGASCLEATYDAEDFWWRGLNSSVGHAPLYYLVTGFAARGLRLIVPAFGLLTWARLLGILWTLGGCATVLAAAQRLRISRWATTAALAIVVAVPGQLAAASMVNPDAALLLVGGGLLLAALHIDDSSWPLWTLAVAASVAAWVDPAAVVAVVFVAVFLAARATSAGRAEVARLLLAAVLTVAAATVATASWLLLFRSATAPADFTGSPQAAAYEVDALPLRNVFGHDAVFALWPPIDQPHAPAELRTEPVRVLGTAAGALLVGSLVGGLLRARLNDRVSALTVATAAALIVSAPLLVVTTFVVSGLYFGIPSRYGLSALAPMALILARGAATRIGRALTGGAAVGLVAVTLLAML